MIVLYRKWKKKWQYILENKNDSCMFFFLSRGVIQLHTYTKQKHNQTIYELQWMNKHTSL